MSFPFLLLVSALLSLLFTSTPSSSSSDSDGLFTSNADLQEVLWTEAELVRGMRGYIREEEDRIRKLKRLESIA